MSKNAIVGQSGGPTAVINASLAGVYEGCKNRGIKVYGMKNGVAGLLNEQVVDLQELLPTALEIELLKRTPSSYLGSCRYKLKNSNEDDADYVTLFRILEKLNIGYFFYIGGNDSMDTIAKLSAYAENIGSDIRFIGVPKTIDNDLAVTDHTPGYGSAAKYIATVMKEIIRDISVYDTKSLTIVEIMGRNAGWLTAAAALSKGEDCAGPDMICLPEIPFDTEEFLNRICTLQETKKNLIIAVSEGVKTKDGRYVCELGAQDTQTDVFGHTQLTGVGRFLENLVAQRLKIKVRSIELSTLQRCAGHLTSRTDVTEAYQVGDAAARSALAGETGKMVVLKRVSDTPYQCTTALYSIAEIANLEKTLPLSWVDTNTLQMKQEFLDYAYPLIQAEIPSVYVSGLPYHLCLDA